MLAALLRCSAVGFPERYEGLQLIALTGLIGEVANMLVDAMALCLFPFMCWWV